MANLNTDELLQQFSELLPCDVCFTQCISPGGAPTYIVRTHSHVGTKLRRTFSGKSPDEAWEKAFIGLHDLFLTGPVRKGLQELLGLHLNVTTQQQMQELREKYNLGDLA